MLYAYLDPSGLHDGSPVVSISGFVSDEASWREFDRKWTAILDKRYWPSRISRFHAFDCVQGEGEFLKGNWRFPERLALYGELTELIKNSDVRPVSSSVIDCFGELTDEDLALISQPETRLGTPLDVAFHMIAQQIIRCVRELGDSVSVGVIFDQDEKRKAYFSEFAERYMSSYHLGDTFSGYGFGDSRKITPLQAADLLAYGTHHVAQRDSGNPVATEFPIIPAFWGMLLGLAARPNTSPHGFMIKLDGLQEIVEKVKAKDMLPRKQ